jgi:hypothetical protein
MQTHVLATQEPATPPIPPSTGPSLHDIATPSVQVTELGWQRPLDASSNPEWQTQRPLTHCPA